MIFKRLRTTIFTKARLFIAAQVLLGALIGWGMAQTLKLPEEQAALAGTVITLVTFLADEAFTLPDEETKVGGAVRMGLRVLSMTGFIMALQSLLVLNGWQLG